jgi:hypothetical protein
LGAYPPLEGDKLEKFRINYRELVVPPESMWNSLKNTSQYFAVLQMLYVNIAQSDADIRDKTRQFIGENGFLSDDLAGVDVFNTYHGLVLYKQFDLLSALPLDQIQQFLLGELDFCINLNLEKTAYIIMALKVIDPDILMLPNILPKVQSFQVENFMNFEETYKFEEYFYLSLVLKAFNFEAVIREVMESFAGELANQVDALGSVEFIVTQTAFAFLAAQLVGVSAPQEELLARMENYLETTTEYFSEDTRRAASWNDDELYFGVELDMLYWSLLALTNMYPGKADMPKQVFCPQCGQFFKALPKFCNQCGFKF